MSDPGSISRLDKLRALQEWLDWQLRQTRGRIQQLEAQERQGQERRAPQRQRGREQGKPPVEKRESEKRRPRTFPDWGITDIGVGTLRSEVHRGDCFAAGKQLRAISREQALAALGDGIQACEVCRPDLVLGAL
ncbi:DUF6233 domain-containing protein [Streptomyces sp. NBC_01320]|uniref:DUF6233 domain-containing protein n=1 Tax=Streptomyces sp. NBC_01320 TaxID=2903824 RepID=UPI002E1265A0|nr:DUF6233 domain-containing protein [Streptomyces sp. NBC_01320]